MDFPDSLSPDDLKSLLTEAKSEDELLSSKKNAPFCGFTKEELEAIVIDHCEELTEKIRHPMADKLAILTRLDRIAAWHEEMSKTFALKALKQESMAPVDVALGWQEDYGKIKAAMAIIASVRLCSSDFFADGF